MAKNRECDVLVVGGGPAGSTIAALLAQKNKQVVVLEKERFPRFHIGESLLPLNLPLFDRLGIAETTFTASAFTSPVPNSFLMNTMRPPHFVLRITLI